MKRYDYTTNYGQAVMEEDEGGEYVKFSDAVEEICLERAKLAWALDQIDSLENALTALREKTIRECAAAVCSNEKTSNKYFQFARTEILALLEKEVIK